MHSAATRKVAPAVAVSYHPQVKWLLPPLLVLACACGRQEPMFLSVLLPADTHDTVGPYRIEAYVDVPNGVGRFLLRVQRAPNSELFSERMLKPVDPDHEEDAWFVELPGRPPGHEYAMFLMLADLGGALVRDPEDAPTELHRFQVLYPPVSEP